jgi:hypothetical protein
MTEPPSSILKRRRTGSQPAAATAIAIAIAATATSTTAKGVSFSVLLH